MEFDPIRPVFMHTSSSTDGGENRIGIEGDASDASQVKQFSEMVDTSGNETNMLQHSVDDNKATVLIWNNNTAIPIVGRHSVTGHAAVVLGRPKDGEAMDEREYVSWGPGYGTRTGGHRPGEAWTAIHDAAQYAPDHVVQIDNVNRSAMQAEWDQIRSKPDAHYRAQVKNCATVAGRVLKASLPEDSTLLSSPSRTPLQVKRLAQDMGGKEIGWTQFVNEANYGDYYLSLKKRSSAHGNPDTPARFVNGVDTGIRINSEDTPLLGQD